MRQHTLILHSVSLRAAISVTFQHTQIVNVIFACLSCFSRSSSLPGKLLHILHFAFLKPNLNIKLLCKSHL